MVGWPEPPERWDPAGWRLFSGQREVLCHGRARDGSGGEFTHPFEYDPVANNWTTKAATYPDAVEQHGLRRAQLSLERIHLLRRRLGVHRQTTTGRVFRYDPVADTISYRRCSLAAWRHNTFCQVASRISKQALHPWWVRRHLAVHG